MVAVKHGPGFVSSHLHGDSFGNGCSDHIPYCCPSEVVQDLTRKSSNLASPMPNTVILGNPFSIFVENVGDNLLGLSLDSQGRLPLLL